MALKLHYGAEISYQAELERLRLPRLGISPAQTSTLRAWFDTHIDHPYPTPTEKTQLARTTQLDERQVSQCS